MLQAAEELNIDLQASYVVGDRFKDIEMARNAGAKAILVLTGYGKGELEFLGPTSKVQADFVAEDLGEAVDWILADAHSNPKPQRPQRSRRFNSKPIEELNRLSDKIIGLAIEVHRGLGPGLLESVYQQCLAYEFSKQNLRFTTEQSIPVDYKGIRMDCAFRADFIVEDSIILELKTVDRILPIHEAQLLTYLKITGKKLGLLINFNQKLLRHGIRRIIL
jgi:GxxExxY protein